MCTGQRCHLYPYYLNTELFADKCDRGLRWFLQNHGFVVQYLYFIHDKYHIAYTVYFWIAVVFNSQIYSILICHIQMQL